MSRDDKFVYCAGNGKYTSVKRYLKCTYWGHGMSDRVMGAAVLADDEKMFNLLLNNDTILSNITLQCLIRITVEDKEYNKGKYINRIMRLRTFRTEEIIDLYLQMDRLKKLYGIRKKMINQNV